MSILVHTGLTDYHPSSRTVDAENGSLLARAAAKVRLWRKRIREKQALERLELADFGASPSDVYAELRRPFWRAPPMD